MGVGAPYIDSMYTYNTCILFFFSYFKVLWFTSPRKFAPSHSADHCRISAPFLASTNIGLCGLRDLHSAFVFLSLFSGSLSLLIKVMPFESLSKLILLSFIIQRIINCSEAM